LFATDGLDAVPLQDPRLKQWRHNFTGVRWLDADTRLVPYDGNRSWVPGAFRDAVSLVQSGQRPGPGPECVWCRFAARWA
jgi:hypothetical protein